LKRGHGGAVGAQKQDAFDRRHLATFLCSAAFPSAAQL
jgi:hypothetical protein